MNIKSVLKKDGIEVINQIDTLIVNSIAKSISRRIVETFPDFGLNESELFSKLAKLNMYKAKMMDGMAEAKYYYKNTSVYFNEHIEIEDIEEFAIHECIHYLQEIKDDKNNLLKMGLCDYIGSKPIGLGLNEAAVQYMASRIIGIDADFEKYYDISLYTPSPSYYPLECALLNEIVYFTGDDILFKSTLFSNDDFKNKVIEMTSPDTYNKIQYSFDKIIELEEHILKLNAKISLLDDGDSKIDKLINKLNKNKQKIASSFINTQNLIIQSFFDYEFNNITNLEELEILRRKLYKYSDIIGSVQDYKFFDNYYVEMMNKLEHKCNILENGGTETVLSNKSHHKLFILLHKILNIFSKNKSVDNEKYLL